MPAASGYLGRSKMQRPPFPGDNGVLDFALAILSGVLLALSFPRFGHPAFAWIALVPLLIALSRRQPPLPRVRPRPHLGLLYFVGTIYWTGTVVATFGGLATPVAIVAMLLLALYLALFPALAALITSAPDHRAGAGGLLFAAGRVGGHRVLARVSSSAAFRGCRSATAR